MQYSYLTETGRLAVTAGNGTGAALDCYPPTGADEIICRGVFAIAGVYAVSAAGASVATPPAQPRTFYEAPSSTGTSSTTVTGSEPSMPMTPPSPPLSVPLLVQEIGSPRPPQSTTTVTHPLAPTSKGLRPSPGEGLAMLLKPATPMPPTTRPAVSTPRPQQPPSTGGGATADCDFLCSGGWVNIIIRLTTFPRMYRASFMRLPQQRCCRGNGSTSYRDLRRP